MFGIGIEVVDTAVIPMRIDIAVVYPAPVVGIGKTVVRGDPLKGRAHLRRGFFITADHAALDRHDAALISHIPVGKGLGTADLGRLRKLGERDGRLLPGIGSNLQQAVFLRHALTGGGKVKGLGQRLSAFTAAGHAAAQGQEGVFPGVIDDHRIERLGVLRRGIKHRAFAAAVDAELRT